MEKAGNSDELMAEEDKAGSECCSGCQSGWTLYLDQSQSQAKLASSFRLRTEEEEGKEEEDEEAEEEEEEEEEEDSSMLSDASSGPPHVHEEEDNVSCCCDERHGCLCNAAFFPLTSVPKNGIKRRRDEEEKQESQDSFLDDTASSTLFTISKAITHRKSRTRIFYFS